MDMQTESVLRSRWQFYFLFCFVHRPKCCSAVIPRLRGSKKTGTGTDQDGGNLMQDVDGRLSRCLLLPPVLAGHFLFCARLLEGMARLQTAFWFCCGLMSSLRWAWMDPIRSRRKRRAECKQLTRACVAGVGPEAICVGSGLHIQMRRSLSPPPSARDISSLNRAAG